jgi:probable rRNA maturation factor
LRVYLLAMKRIDINVVVESEFSRRVVRKDLRRAVLSTLRAEKALRGQGLTLVVVSDKTIRELNRRFHKADSPTDVLSFSSDEEGYLGDIIISYETARVNARAARWRARDELALLAVHGVLHLLGYDDSTTRTREKMWRRQEAILARPR